MKAWRIAIFNSINPELKLTPTYLGAKGFEWHRAEEYEAPWPHFTGSSVVGLQVCFQQLPIASTPYPPCICMRICIYIYICMCMHMFFCVCTVVAMVSGLASS